MVDPDGQAKAHSRSFGLWVLLAVLAVAAVPFATVFFSQLSELGYQGAWAAAFGFYAIPTMLPMFADLRTITHGAECWVHGIDVYVIDPCDPWGRPTNYPPIWLEISKAIGVDSRWTVPIGGFFAASFGVAAIAFFGRRRMAWHGLVYGLALISPPVMLGIERGNPDIFIFTLIVIGLFLAFRGYLAAVVATGVFAFATALKLFPIYSAAILLIRSGRAAMIAVAVVLFGAAYFTLNAEYLASISANTSRGTLLSFGAEVIFNGLAASFDWPALRGAATPTLFGVSAVAIGLGIYIGRRNPAFLPLPRTRWGGGFAIGAAIYLFSFMVASNWDYRLSFVLLCIPQWLDWASARDLSVSERLIARTLLTTFVVSAYLTNRLPFAVLYIDEVFNWVLFFLLAVIVTVLAGRVIGDIRNYLAAPG